MTYAQILKACDGSTARICKEFGVTHQAVYKWRKNGVVPPLRVYQWQERQQQRGK